MNQDINNLNSNNFNTQGNNGIPNNQLSNNQSFNSTINQNVAQNPNGNQSTFNQPPINSQPQVVSGFQQPINQVSVAQPIPQPINTTLEGGNNSNQDKSSKKSKLGVVIGIVITIGIIIVGIFLIFVFSKSKKEVPNDNLVENIEGSYDNVFENPEVFSFLYEDEKSVYYIDEKNKIYEYTGYKSIDFVNEYAIFSKEVDGKTVYGVMDKNEKEIIKPGMYSSIENFDEVNLYEVRSNSLNGVVDSTGTLVVPTEYESISLVSFGSSDTYLFLAEKDDKYYYVSSNGTVMTETDNFGMFTMQIETFPKIKENTDAVVFIDNKNYYNANTGELLFENKTDINFEYNILFEEKNSITLYDKDLKVKEQVLTPNTSSIDIYQLKSGYVLLTEDIYSGNTHFMKYRIYDEDLNLKKEVECPNATNLTVEEIDENYFYIKQNASSAGANVKYKTTLYDKELNEYVREGQNSSNCHINNKNEIVFIESDYSKKIVSLYSIDGESIAQIENHSVNTNYSYGNYIALVETDTSNRFYDIYNLNGELVAEDADYINSGNFDSDSIKYLQREDAEDSVLLPNDKEIKEIGYSWIVSGNSLVAYNSETDHVKIYDVTGKLVKEINKVDSIISSNNNYIILKKDNKYNVYSIRANKFVFEIDIDLYEDEFSDDDLYVIELSDGFYSFEGEKLLSKN